MPAELKLHIQYLPGTTATGSIFLKDGLPQVPALRRGQVSEVSLAI